MGNDYFKVIAIFSRSDAGALERVYQPIELQGDDEITLIPTTNGIIVITDVLRDEDQPVITKLLGEILPTS